MWSIALSTVMISLIGAYAYFGQVAELGPRHHQGAALAESMAVYRGAVVRYYGTHDNERDTSVDLVTLRAQGALRDWSTLDVGRWDNYRAADGTIYIYGDDAVAADVGAALARQSRNSLMAGTYRRSSATLHSPGHGDTRIPLAPLLARRALRDGAPVWLAVAP